MHFNHLECLSVKLKGELEFFELSQALVQTHESDHVFTALMAFILLEQLQVEIHLIDVQIAIRAEQGTPLTIVLHVPR